MIYKITNLANLKHSKAKTECANECDINILNCINFNGVDDNSIVKYNEFLEKIPSTCASKNHMDH